MMDRGKVVGAAVDGDDTGGAVVEWESWILVEVEGSSGRIRLGIARTGFSSFGGTETSVAFTGDSGAFAGEGGSPADCPASWLLPTER
jgi:hypothetical protein